MSTFWPQISINQIVDVTDYVANGSFASLKENVTYCAMPDYAILVRLVDFNAGWKGDFVYVTRKSYFYLKKSSLDVGDIIIANVGANAGTVFRVPNLGRPMTLGPNAIVLKPKESDEYSKRYLYFYFSSPLGQQQLQSIISGSAQPKFNKTDFRRLKVIFPPKSERLAIAHILGTLDDKIEPKNCN